MSNKETSTLQSYVDNATGTLQSALGSLTGNTTDKVQGENKKADADTREELSHATAKVGPFTATPTGAAKDNKDRTDGSWNQTFGSAKEALGNLTGMEGLKQDGIKQNQAGKEQEAKGQLTDLGEGVMNRAKGTVGGAVSSLLGDERSKASYEEMHNSGKATQRGVEADLQKQVDAEEKSRTS